MEDSLASQKQHDTQPPILIGINGDGEEKVEWQVEEILEVKKVRGRTELLIKWSSYDKPI